VYTLAISTYAIALWHFGSELLIFRSVKVNRASAGPLIVACQSSRVRQSLVVFRPSRERSLQA
jgi:hypothetical protein